MVNRGLSWLTVRRFRSAPPRHSPQNFWRWFASFGVGRFDSCLNQFRDRRDTSLLSGEQWKDRQFSRPQGQK